jgi:hypothetical protein
VESKPIRPDLLSAPTETEVATTSVPATETSAPAPPAPVAAPSTETPTPAVAVEAPRPMSEGTAIEAGQIVPDSRPEPKTFVTASEGLPRVGDLSISEKVPEAGEHSTRAGALLDPALKN